MAAARDGVNQESSHSSIRMTMVRVSIVATASLAFMVSMAVAPPAAVAERFRDGPGGRVVATPRPFTTPLAPRPFVTPRPFAQPFVRPFVPHRPCPPTFNCPFVTHRPFFPRHGIHPFVVGGGPVVVYTPPPIASYPTGYYAAPAYYDPPVVYGAPMAGAVSVAPSPEPMPSVVEYPTGRYELRGDGMSTPYTWVWIPNPPPPPVAPSPAAPAPAAPPAGAGASDNPAPPRHSQLYRWIDPAGVVHWTDRLDAVPRQYRPVALDRASSLN